MKVGKYIPYILFFLFLVFGFLFRLRGIIDNHSFWSDEAYVSSMARDIVLGKQSMIGAISNISYQTLYILVVTIFFKVFGISEFSARLPSILVGTLGIIVSFLLAKKLSNIYGGLLATFLFAFSQINIANSTQAKPYVFLEVLLILFIYLLVLLNERTRSKGLIHVLIITTIVISTLLHFLGALLWIPYALYIVTKHRHKLSTVLRDPKRLILFLILFVVAAWVFQVRTMVEYLTYSGKILPYNHISLVRELLWRNYAFILLPAIGGLAILKNKNSLVSILVVVLIFVYLFLSSFIVYHFSVRYLLPLFGVFFVYFGIFWGMVGEKLMGKKAALVCLSIIALLYIGGYKISRKPSFYYSPNADLYGSVQSADYKSLYASLKKDIPSLENIAIFNDVIDTQVWYLPIHLPDAFFVKGNSGNLAYGKSSIHKDTGKPIYTTLNQFLKEMKKYPKGILIVEDWESLLPDDIKEYAKKNLKLEVRIEGLSQAQGDNWPLAAYSWGLE